jgi:succinoglycan biosynthesis transport protein ExoP
MHRQTEFTRASEQDDENSFALFALAWRRKWIVMLLIAIGLGLGYLFYLQQTPIYQSRAEVLIVRNTTNGPIDELKVSSSYDTVHERLLRSPRVLKNAIERLEMLSLPTLAPLWVDYSHVEDLDRKERLEDERDHNIALTIMGHLAVEVGHNYSGDLLDLTYRSEYPEECPKVLFAVHGAYQDYQKEIYEGEGEDTGELIEKASKTLLEELGDAKKDYLDFRKQYKDVLLFIGKETENVHGIRARNLEAKLGELEDETNAKQKRVDWIVDALDRGARPEAVELMIDKPAVEERDDASVEAMVERELLPKRTKLEQLLKIRGPDYPEVRQLQDEIRMAREVLLGAKSENEEPSEFLDTYLAGERLEIAFSREQLGDYRHQFEQEMAKAASFLEAQLLADYYYEKVESLEAAYRVVLKHMSDLEIVKGRTSTKVELIYPPGIGYQVEPDLMTVMIAAGLLGMLSGLGLAFVIDRADRRFHSPDEIRSDLGIPVVGHIPVLPGIKPGKKSKHEREEVAKVGELAAALRTYHHPRGRIAEAYRAVRTALYFSTRGSGHQVIQVTSPSPGDGKSTLSGNLALSIANSGKRALLIDADFRRPRIHKLFGLDNSTGISSVIEGKSEIVDAVQETEVENLSILSCGPRPNNPSELLSSKRFAELLELLREQYDLVIVDTPPVLAVTDPLNVVARVDGVLLVLRLTKSARTMGHRALEALDGMGANVLGIVINGVGSEKKGYGYGYSCGKYGYGYGKSGYGGYKYGYGSDYAYQYRYSEGYEDDKVYYEDEPPAEANGKSSKIVQKSK